MIKGYEILKTMWVKIIQNAKLMNLTENTRTAGSYEKNDENYNSWPCSLLCKQPWMLTINVLINKLNKTYIYRSTNSDIASWFSQLNDQILKIEAKVNSNKNNLQYLEYALDI